MKPLLSMFKKENEVNLTEQNPSLKYCQPLEIFTQFKKGLDLSMLKVGDLQIKGLQSYWSSNFENDLTPVQLESGPPGSRGAGAGWLTFSSQCAPGFSNPNQKVHGLFHFYIAGIHKTDQNQLKKPSVIRLPKFTSINLAEKCHQ